MVLGEEIFKKGTKWLLGYERKLEFWNDNWTNHGPLRKIIQGTLSKEATNLKIKEVVDYTGRWDWSLIQMNFPEEVFNDIKAIPIPFSAKFKDRLAWKYSNKGDFELKSAYGLATNS